MSLLLCSTSFQSKIILLSSGNLFRLIHILSGSVAKNEFPLLITIVESNICENWIVLIPSFVNCWFIKNKICLYDVLFVSFLSQSWILKTASHSNLYEVEWAPILLKRVTASNSFKWIYMESENNSYLNKIELLNQVHVHIDGLVQDCSNSSALTWSYFSLALNHRYTSIADTQRGFWDTRNTQYIPTLFYSLADGYSWQIWPQISLHKTLACKT